MCRPQGNVSLSTLSTDAKTRLTESSRIRERWAKHFSDVLNRSSTISLAAIDNITQRPLMDELAQHLTIETTAAIKKLSSGKAGGPGAIAAEIIYRYGEPKRTKRLVKLFNNIWDSRAVTQGFNESFSVHIYKMKGAETPATTTVEYL